MVAEWSAWKLQSIFQKKGAKVTVLEMMKEFCADMGSTRKICVTEQIYQDGITRQQKRK